MDDNSVVGRGSRAEHLAWCKKRALYYVDRGDLISALTSMTSDLNKHPETQGHAASELGMSLMIIGDLDTPEKMRKWIEGCN